MTAPHESGGGPVRPLTARQLEVAHLLRRGLSYGRVARELGIERRTVRAHVRDIAMILPNPDGLPAGKLVTLWAVRQLWYVPTGSGE